MAFHRVTALADLWSGDLLAARVAGVAVLVLRVGDTVRAYEDRCAHLGVALSAGTLADNVLTCSAHHWQYDASTGRGLNPATACLRAFAVEIRDGAVYVDPAVPA
ncbi:MAG: Rieske 2Fe-2S domain-containing protein [Deltaproteobacteria bacterium]|nr:Rieske 2Fe-2S domain-containing protein [Deltaproteobacteria bacterium]